MHLENLISGSYSVVNVQSITLLPASILKVQVLHPYQPGKMLPKSLKDVPDEVRKLLQNCGCTEDVAAETIRNRESA